MSTAENFLNTENLQKVDLGKISSEKRKFLEQQMQELAVETDGLISQVQS